jgi:AcrR family transcriptional regulator
MAETRTKRNSYDPMARRSRASEERWRAILDAAAEIFSTRGFEATTIRDIAEAVGMLGGSLYYYIDSKEDLLFAIIDDYHRIGLQAIAQIEAEHGDDSLSTLRAVLAGRITLDAKNRARAAVFHNDFRHLDEPRKAEIIKSRRAHERRVEQLIVAAQEEGSIDTSVSARLAALSILSMSNGSHDWYKEGRGLSPEQLGEFQADLLLNGLAQR